MYDVVSFLLSVFSSSLIGRYAQNTPLQSLSLPSLSLHFPLLRIGGPTPAIRFTEALSLHYHTQSPLPCDDVHNLASLSPEVSEAVDQFVELGGKVVLEPSSNDDRIVVSMGIMDRAGPDSDLCRRLHCPDLPRRAESVPNHAPGREGGQKGALCRLGPNSRLGFVSFTPSPLDMSRRVGGLRSQPDARRVKSWGELVGELEGSDG